jgi:hypothetical protein
MIMEVRLGISGQETVARPHVLIMGFDIARIGAIGQEKIHISFARPFAEGACQIGIGRLTQTVWQPRLILPQLSVST